MSDTKIWLIADTHFGFKGDDEGWLNDYCGYFENEIIPLMERKVDRENDILVHCGDVFDNRATIGINTLTRVIDLFERFSKIFKDIRIVVGNHDMARKSTTDITSVNLLKFIPNVKVYYKPEVDVICGKRCLFNPWIEDLSKEKELLDSVDVNYIFGHLQIGGAKAIDRSGTRAEITVGVKKSDFKSAQVYAGHVHIKQDDKNIHYVGNPYHKDKGDIGNKKGITVLDINSGKTLFVENLVSPRFVRESIYNILNTTVGELKSLWNNNRIELHMKGTDYAKCNFDDLRSCLNNCYKEFIPIGDSNSVEFNTETVMKFSEAKTSDDYVTDFLNFQDMDPGFRKKIDGTLGEYKERI